jgi:hypothetical protein
VDTGKAMVVLVPCAIGILRGTLTTAATTTIGG